MVVGDIVGRGTLVNTVGQMAVVDTMVPTAGTNLTVIKMMLHFKTSKEEAPRIVICPHDGEIL